MEGAAPNIHVATATTIGQRSENQDAAVALSIDPAQSRWGFAAVIAVADGMGGHAAGDVAGRIAADTVVEILSRTHTDEPQSDAERAVTGPVEAVEYAVALANTRIYEQARSQPSQHDMGTTLTMIALTEDTAIVAHIGDSRGYLISPIGIVQITQDHTWVAEQVRAERMTEEEAARSPLRSQIMRTLGAETHAHADIVAIPLEPGSAFIACSDGLTEVLSPPEIEQLVRGEEGVESACAKLVERANWAGVSDNATVACVEFGDINRAPVAAPAAREMTQELYPAVRSRARGHDDRALQRLRPLVAAVAAVVIVALLLLVRSCMLAPGRQSDVDEAAQRPERVSAFELPPVSRGLVVRIAVIDGKLVAGANRHVQLTIHQPGATSGEEPKTVIGPEGDYTRALTEAQAGEWVDAHCQIRIWAENDGVHFESDPDNLEIYVNRRMLTGQRISSGTIGDDAMRVGFYFPANDRDGFTVALTRIDVANLPSPTQAADDGE